MLEDDLILQRNKIPGYRFENFGECVRLWQVWEEKKILPYSGGYLEQPADFVDTINAFDRTAGVYRAQQQGLSGLQSKGRRRR